MTRRSTIVLQVSSNIPTSLPLLQPTVALAVFSNMISTSLPSLLSMLKRIESSISKFFFTSGCCNVLTAIAFEASLFFDAFSFNRNLISGDSDQMTHQLL